jgi:hypothetical protein
LVDYLNNITYETTVTIASGATTSGAVDLLGMVLVGIIMPSAFTGTSITFQASPDNSTFTAVYNSAGTQLTATVSTSRTILFSPGDFVGVRNLKLVSGSTEGGSRIITLILRKLA